MCDNASVCVSQCHCWSCWPVPEADFKLLRLVHLVIIESVVERRINLPPSFGTGDL